MKRLFRYKVPLLVLLAAAILAVSFTAAYAAEERHWWDAFSWFGDIANFVKSLVVPPANYFHNRLAKLNGLVNEKFSGVGQLYQILNDFFYKIGDPASADLTLRIPNNFLFSGYRGFSLNFFGAATTYISFLRTFLTACVSVFTVIVCYHKLRTFFTGEG